MNRQQPVIPAKPSPATTPPSAAAPPAPAPSTSATSTAATASTASAIEVKQVTPAKQAAPLAQTTPSVETGNNITFFAILVLQDLLKQQLSNPITNFNNIIATAGTLAYLNASLKNIP